MAGDLTFNKYAAAILATALGFMLIKEIAHGAIHAEKPKGLAYLGSVDFGPKDGGDTADKPLPFPQQDWIDAMDAEKGEKYFQACSTCHTVNKGGDNLQGPNLWNVVGRPAGDIEYAYSAGMSSMEMTWGYEELDLFLTKPTKFVKGTKMGYGGERKPEKRAALIEYLRTLSDNPISRPVAAAAPGMAEGVTDISAPTENDAPKVIETVTDKVDGAMEDVKDSASDIVDKAAEVAGDVKDDASDLVDKATDLANDVKSDVKDGTDAAMDKAAEKVDSVVDDVKDAIKGDE